MLLWAQGDFKHDPKESAEGRMWTPGAVDFFRILNEQVSVVAEVNRDTMLLRVGRVRCAAVLPQHWRRTRSAPATRLTGCCTDLAQAAVQTMQGFQSAQRRHVNEGLGLEMLCAIINNNLLCYNESQEFAEQLDEALAEHVKGARERERERVTGREGGGELPWQPADDRLAGAGDLDIDVACRGFVELAKEATAACVATVFADPAFADLFSRVAAGEEWRSGVLVGSIVATLEDFIQDFQRMVDPNFFRRYALPDCLVTRRGVWMGLTSRWPLGAVLPMPCWKSALRTTWRRSSVTCAV